MNQEKIGKFISQKRKEKGLTQRRLAESRGVSTNAVSKWERGLCLMDMSLLKPLSEILGVSVNDILSGEVVSDREIRKKAEENLINISDLYILNGIKSGAIAMIGLGSFIVFYSLSKGLNICGYLSMLLTFSGTAFCERYRLTGEKLLRLSALCCGIWAISYPIAFIIAL